MEQEQGEHGRPFFSNSSTSRAVRSLLRSCARPPGRTSRNVRLHPWMPSLKHRERSEHAGPRRARYRRPHLGSEDKVFRVRYPGRACARVDRGAGSRSESEGALCLLSRDARPGPNSKRRRIASRFQGGRKGRFRRETRTRCFFVNLFFGQFYRRLVKYKPRKSKTKPHAN